MRWMSEFCVCVCARARLCVGRWVYWKGREMQEMVGNS